MPGPPSRPRCGCCSSLVGPGIEPVIGPTTTTWPHQNADILCGRPTRGYRARGQRGRRVGAGCGAERQGGSGATVKLTGERPMEGATPDSLLAFHDAGYREVIARIGHGSDPRRRAAGSATRRPGWAAPTATSSASTTTPRPPSSPARSGVPAGPAAPTWPSPAPTAPSSDSATPPSTPCARRTSSSTSTRPRATWPSSRVCADDGTVFVITPNRPADFENPFHVYLFEAAELASLLRLFFDDVEVLGLEGDDVLKADFAQRRVERRAAPQARSRSSSRHRMPRSWYVWSYEHVLPGRVQGARLRDHRHRLRSRPVALLHDRRDRADDARPLRDRASAAPLLRQRAVLTADVRSRAPAPHPGARRRPRGCDRRGAASSTPTCSSGGYLGVDLFFVLSGFLITSLLLAESTRTRHVNVLAFWARRARRLLPALFLMLVGVGALRRVRRRARASSHRIRGDALATLAYVANWRYVVSGFDYFALFHVAVAAEPHVEPRDRGAVLPGLAARVRRRCSRSARAGARTPTGATATGSPARSSSSARCSPRARRR